MHKILVLFAHPALQKSVANKPLFDAIQDLDGVTCHDLYEIYPDAFIDIKKEQLLLTEHDIIIFQFPLYWYSSPAILKDWQDLVLEHGFAYGNNGNCLAGKHFMLAVTTGGSENSYSPDGYNRHNIETFFLPFSQMSRICKMNYLPPFITHDINKNHEPEHIKQRSQQYRSLLLSLQAADDLKFKGVG